MTTSANTFSPAFKKCGFCPPDIVDRLRDLGDGPKRTYRKLCQRCGNKDHCWPSLNCLAIDLGKSVRQVLYNLGRLVAYGLISRHRRGPGKSTYYFIMQHHVFDGSRKQENTAI
jgi:hypothetical protein